jgi:hypothetical protein
MDRIPWTHEELQALIPACKEEMSQIEEEEFADSGTRIKPLPPLTKNECLDYFWRLTKVAEQRPLTREETFVHSELVAQFEQAVLAERMGYKGRYYVVSQEQIEELMKRQQDA